MGIEEVRKEIIDNAKENAKKVIKEAEKEKQAILSAADERIISIKEKIKQDEEKAIGLIKSMSSAEISSLSKKERLLLEKELLEEVFWLAKKEISSLPEKKREAHIKKLLSATKKDFKFSKIYCSEKDILLLKAMKPAKEDIIGGIVLENSDGTERIDLSYESLLEDMKKDHISEISKIIFK